MGQHALGEIKPNSTTTGLRATNNQSTPSNAYPAQAIQFQALTANTGEVMICDRQTPTLTAHVHMVIPKPAAGPPQVLPTWTVSNPAGANPLNASEYWIVPAVSGEGVRITAIRS